MPPDACIWVMQITVLILKLANLKKEFLFRVHERGV